MSRNSTKNLVHYLISVPFLFVCLLFECFHCKEQFQTFFFQLNQVELEQKQEKDNF